MKKHLSRLTTHIPKADKAVMFISEGCEVWFFTNKSDKMVDNFRRKYDDRRNGVQDNPS